MLGVTAHRNGAKEPTLGNVRGRGQLNTQSRTVEKPASGFQHQIWILNPKRAGLGNSVRAHMKLKALVCEDPFQR